MTACELEPSARKKLIEALRRDTQARVVDLDGWTALPAFVPPNERRGPRADRSAVRGQGRVRAARRTAFPPPSRNGRPAATYSGIRPRAGARPTTLAQRGRARSASVKPAGKCLRLEFSVAPQAADAALTSSRALDRQPAVDVARRAQDHPARAGKAARTGRRRPLPIGDAESLSRVLDGKSVFNLPGTVLCSRPGLALRSASANGCGGVTRPNKNPGRPVT